MFVADTDIVGIVTNHLVTNHYRRLGHRSS
jgi:hypothetical protein